MNKLTDDQPLYWVGSSYDKATFEVRMILVASVDKYPTDNYVSVHAGDDRKYFIKLHKEIIPNAIIKIQHVGRGFKTENGADDINHDYHNWVVVEENE